MHYLTKETRCCLESHPKFICNILLQPTGLDYLADFSKKQEIWKTSYLILAKFVSHFPLCPAECLALFCEAGILKDSCLVLAKFSGLLPVCPICPVLQHTATQSSQVQFLAQMACFATMEPKSMRSFFDAHHLLWSKLVLPGANVSHCHEKPYAKKPF